ncbi:hypothetical protein [Nonomuraea sp. NPDC049504]|uniref:hypothetical protein n=1 Tax=Nonomuraea sp. NPDC049504 TaxID=3154729 RepID=UPI00343D1F01
MTLQMSSGEWRAQQPARRRLAARLQRAGWTAFALVGGAALAGLMGPGPLSWASVVTPTGSVRMDYERFTRLQGDTSLQLRVRRDVRQPDKARVWISKEYLSTGNVQQVVPTPESWIVANDGYVLTFALIGPADHVMAEIELNPGRLGLSRGKVGAPGEEPVGFWQFAYP